MCRGANERMRNKCVGIYRKAGEKEQQEEVGNQAENNSTTFRKL